ncbi:hypothetical protein Poly24_26630 [Rosistilla carotiformis]|uniref:Uncharacterized protein n=1 Tax=Rosistilla carotiformis TaxID=2528017 RepID=A0A518JTS7_9BACT|nr:hypothetical protein Poly24_26630 [Rosistilla carotiformis]
MRRCIFCRCDGVENLRPHRATHMLRWALPSLGLCMIPKCPLCVSAYLFGATGIALPLPLASGLQTGAMALCIGTLTVLACTAICRRAQVNKNVNDPAEDRIA